MPTNVKNSASLDEKSFGLPTSEKPTTFALEAQKLLADIEGLIADATTMTSEELTKAKAKLNESIDSIKESFYDLDGGISERARRGVAITNNYVHEQPWVGIGTAAVVGVVVGALLARRC